MKKMLWPLILLFLVLTFSIPAEAKSNYQIVKSLAKSLHKSVKVVKFNSRRSDFIISHRKGKNYIVAEKVVTFSDGNRGGWTKDGWYVTYNKHVPRDKKVTSYIIYSPCSNKFDDILWIVDNKTFR